MKIEFVYFCGLYNLNVDWNVGHSLSADGRPSAFACGVSPRRAFLSRSLVPSVPITLSYLLDRTLLFGLGRDLRISSVLGKVLEFLNIGDPKRGADIIVRLALDSEYERVTGGYFNVGTGDKIDPIFPGKDVSMQQSLWNDTKELLLEYIK
ncbi:hypothetical protein AB9M92_06885 [Peribacillus frigoritolerans]|uniref:hypothetical protein n=1 Tax=Peribacillus frigoritolerans TaxID=450367 RepID=UPI0035185172